MEMTTSLRFFLDDELCATAIEYGLIAALVSVAAITALQTLGGNLMALFNNIASTISGAVTG